MTRPVQMAQFRVRLVQSERLTAGYFRHVYEADDPADFSSVVPGQFVMLRGEWGRDLINGRAFSILDVEGPRRFSILGKVLGRGTTLMHAMEEGASLTCTGPLGGGFPSPTPQSKQLLVAGGVGLPPLLFHARRAAAAGLADSCVFFYGGRGQDELVLLDDLARTGVEAHLATDDGAVGHAGLVTAPLTTWLDAAQSLATVSLLACGPTPMLAAVRKLGLARDVPSYLSLEEQMACGFGVCLGCAVPVTGDKPYRYCCTEGPVFLGSELRWS